MVPLGIYAVVGVLAVVNAYPHLPRGGKVALFVVFPLHVAGRETLAFCFRNW